MTTYERRHRLLNILRQMPGLRVPEMARELQVSDGTVRNDLIALEVDGRLNRVRGGAVLNEPVGLQNTSFSIRHQKNALQKILIARVAAGCVEDNDSIVLDASSTVYYLALSIQNRQRLRIFTNGIDVARKLSQNPTNTVVLIGGTVGQDGSSVTGLFSENVLRELHIQKAFVSCSGFSLERGLTEVHLAEAQLKRKIIEASQQLIALVDSSKLGKEDLTLFARPEQISHLFTDAGITTSWLASLEQSGIRCTVCEEKEYAKK